MAFENNKETADRWTKSSSFNIVDCNENENKIVFQNKDLPNISFWVRIEENKSDWSVWSENDDVCPHLSNALNLISSGRAFNIIDVLNSIEKSLKKLHDNESDEDEDEDLDYYVDNEEDAVRTELPETEFPESDYEGTAQQFVTGVGSNTAVHRLITDMKGIKSSEGKYGVEGGPRGDNLFLWDVKLTNFPQDSSLGKDLLLYANSFNEEPVVSMEMTFPQDYPMAPPVVRVVKPRLRFLTGHVTIGGSVCMEMLTRSGWRPTYDIESTLVQIRAEIMSDKNSCLEKPITNRPCNVHEDDVLDYYVDGDKGAVRTKLPESNVDTKRKKFAEYLASIFGTATDKVNCSFYRNLGVCPLGERYSRHHDKPTFSQTVGINHYLKPQNRALTADGYLASIFGTATDKVNCAFYSKIGVCRHGERCSRLHNKPTFSQTVGITNLYLKLQNRALTADGFHIILSNEEVQEHYDEFFEEVFTELEDKYGEIEEMNVCDNVGEHLVGNVYVKFCHEEDAEKCVEDLNNRWFNARPIHAELSPVTDFREASCRQYEMGECIRGSFCNFMHLKPISSHLHRQLYGRNLPRERVAARDHAVPDLSRSHRSRSRSPRRGGGSRERLGRF